MYKYTLGVLIFFMIGVTASFAQQRNNLTIDSFGEMHYNDAIYDRNNAKTPGNLDFHRFNLLAGYSFNQRISVQTELGLKHTVVTPEEGGEVALKQAFIDLKLEKLGIRAGLLTVPSGLINTNRSPTNFHGVERPNVEQYIIPATWSELGAGVYGYTTIGLSYEVYAMAGLNPSKITGFNGIRRARQNGFRSSTANMALTSSIDYELNSNISFGASYYVSTLKHKLGNGNAEPVPSLKESFFNMGEGHIQYQKNRFEARGLFALSRILDIEDLNKEFGNAAGQIQAGGYVEVAYDILPFFNPLTSKQLFIFARGESYDTNFVTGSIPRNNEFLREEVTLGLTFKPIQKIVFKADYQFLTSLGSKYQERLNIGIGFSF